MLNVYYKHLFSLWCCLFRKLKLVLPRCWNPINQEAYQLWSCFRFLICFSPKFMENMAWIWTHKSKRNLWWQRTLVRVVLFLEHFTWTCNLFVLSILLKFFLTFVLWMVQNEKGFSAFCVWGFRWFEDAEMVATTMVGTKQGEKCEIKGKYGNANTF